MHISTSDKTQKPTAIVRVALILASKRQQLVLRRDLTYVGWRYPWRIYALTPSFKQHKCLVNPWLAQNKTAIDGDKLICDKAEILIGIKLD